MVRKLKTLIVATCLLSGCAARDAQLQSENAACPRDLTFSCVTYNGRQLQCACISREEMEQILEPTRYP